MHRGYLNTHSNQSIRAYLTHLRDHQFVFRHTLELASSANDPLRLLGDHLRELVVGGLEHVRQRQHDASLNRGTMPGRDPLLQAKGKVLGERLDVLHPAAHLLHKVLELGLEVPLHVKREQRGAADHHGHGVLPRHPEPVPEELELGRHGALHAGHQQHRVLERQRARVAEAQAAEVEERRGQLVAHAAGQHARALDEHAAVGGFGDAEAGGEEGEHRGQVVAHGGGEDRGAHAEDAAQILELEPAAGLEEGDDGVDGLRGRVAEGRVEG